MQLGNSKELLDAIQLLQTTPAGDPCHEYHLRMMLIAWMKQQKGNCKPPLLANALSVVSADTWEKCMVCASARY